MDEAKLKSEPVLITDRGKAVAKLVPVSAEDDEIFNFLASKGSVTGDIVSPVIPAANWKRMTSSLPSVCMSSPAAFG